MKPGRYLANILILIGLLGLALLISLTTRAPRPGAPSEPTAISGELAEDESGLTAEDATEVALADSNDEIDTPPPFPSLESTPAVTPIPLASFPVFSGAAESGPWGLVYRSENSLHRIGASDGSEYVLVGSGSLNGLYLAPAALGENAWGAVSPDGRRIALVLGPSADLPQEQKGAVPFTLDLYLYDTGTATLELLAAKAREPAWSPDGNWIAYRGADDGLWIVAVDGSNLRQLYAVDAANGHYVSDLSWSPDSARVAFLDQVFRQSTALHAVSVEGRDQQLVPWEGFPISSPAWSPDGERLVFVSFEGSPERQNAVQSIWLVDARSAQRRQLTEYIYAFRPVWAAGGDILFFDGSARFEEENPLHEIWFVRLSDGAVHRLTDNNTLAANETLVGLSPGNSSLLFIRESSSVWTLSLVDGGTEELGMLPGLEIVISP